MTGSDETELDSAVPRIRDLLDLGTRVLKEAGSSEPRLEAEVLLRYVTGVEREDLYEALSGPVPPGLDEAYGEAVDLRVEGCPTAYITGEREFYSLPIRVNPAVLIPRPETEVLVEVALAIADELSGSLGRPPRVLDVGTGSGCIACALASQREAITVVATDYSRAALDVARENAFELDLEDRIEFVACDLFEAVTGPVDLIVSNPPYVAEGTVLSRDVADYEPRRALFAGPTGYEAIERILIGAPRVLGPGGGLALEVGQGQASRVLKRLIVLGTWTDAGVSEDLAGIPRAVWGRGWEKAYG